MPGLSALSQPIVIARRVGFRLHRAATILAFSLLGTLLEVLSLTVLVPVYQFIEAAGDVDALVESSRAWQVLSEVYAAVGVPLGLATLLSTSFLLIVGRQAFMYLRQTYSARTREDLVRQIRQGGFERYLAASTAYHDATKLGRVVNDLTEELRRAVDNLFGSVAFASHATLIAVYVIVLLALSVPMTLISLLVLCIAAMLLRGILRRSQQTGRAVTALNQNASSFLVERLRLVRLVRLSGTERAEATQMAKLLYKQRDAVTRLRTLLAQVEISMEPVVVGAAFTFIYVAVTHLQMRIEEIGLFLVILLRLLPVFKESARTLQGYLSCESGLLAVDRLLTELVHARETDTGTMSFEGVGSGIVFEGVTFRYPDSNESALRGVDARMRAGEMTAVVGPSGAGKSTLIDMLPRLRRPDGGRISIDGTPIEAFAVGSLRDGIAFAPQTPLIFNVSPGEHIRYGRRDASDADVSEAARLAGADKFIEALPDGYGTPLGEGGIRLSGGQRQRLDLARALVRKAPILLLDEPTSNLDAEAETAFREALDRIRRTTGVTIVIIGHRLSTIRDAERILVLIEGRVADAGSHDELLARGGWYADAYRSQRRDSSASKPSIPEPGIRAEGVQG